MSSEKWEAGDRCKLVDLRRGAVYPAVVVELRGAVVHVQTNRGNVYAVRADSSFLSRDEASE